MNRLVLRGGTALLCLVIAGSVARAEKNWPRWRGPNQDGHAQEKGLPTEWTAASIAWKSPIKGQGQSSPIVWGERIFLTTALERGKERIVLCVNRNDGQVVWEKSVWTGTPEPSHAMNGWASATCATDGERVYAFFGHGGGLCCFSLDGDLLWQKDLGEFAGPWGTAACPVLVDDLVIQNCDADQDAYLLALNKKTGEQVWKQKRQDIRGWSTPILIEANGRRELVLNGDSAVRSYDPATGQEQWSCKSFIGRGEPTITPIGGTDLLCALNGKTGPVYAIKPGGSGDVTKTHMAWQSEPRKGGRDLASPIVLNGYALVMNMQGLLSCFDAKTGKQLWIERAVGNYSAAPIAYDGLAFFVEEGGETVVVRPGPKPEIVARNVVNDSDEEIFRASLTPSDGQIFLRSDRVLYCIGRRAGGK